MTDELLKTGYVGNIWSSSIYVSKVIPKKTHRKIVGQTFKQIAPFVKKCGPGKKYRRTLFYKDIVTAGKLSSGKAWSYSGGWVYQIPRVYPMAINGITQIAGGVTYYQLRRYFVEC